MMPLLTVSSVTSDTVDVSTSSLDKAPSEEESLSGFKCGVSEAMEGVFLWPMELKELSGTLVSKELSGTLVSLSLR